MGRHLSPPACPEDEWIHRAMAAIGDPGLPSMIASKPCGKIFMILALGEGEDPLAVASGLGLTALYFGPCHSLKARLAELQSDAALAEQVHET